MPVRRPEQSGHHRKGQSLAGRHYRRDHRRGRPDQHLPGLPLQPGRQTTREQTRPGRLGNSILTIAWYLLSDPGAHFTDLGPDWHDRLAPPRRKRQLIAELERLSGRKVTLRERQAA
jgi:hypothetical protein